MTEDFLLGFPDVMDASVWMTDNTLSAYVSLLEGSRLGEADIKRACADSLGPHQVPRAIEFCVVRQWAA